LLSIPNYVLKAGIDSLEIRFTWDEWGSKKNIYRREGDELLSERACELSQRGRMALVNGIAEWVAYRFKSLLGTNDPFDFLEAAWAGEVDRRYLLPFDVDDPEWSGPVKGVVRRALEVTQDCVDLGWQNGETARLLVRITNLARYVLPQTEAFDEWLIFAVAKTKTVSPSSSTDFLGAAVARESLDPDCSTMMGTDALIRRLLESVSPERNRFVPTTQMLLGWGFHGAPYTFSETRDEELKRELMAHGIEALYPTG
jgi:hypothetical protein